ncbi:MAG: A24 family peptidase C-terminal domain-containing protein [Candidatus Syntropharchaeales archaeon]
MMLVRVILCLPFLLYACWSDIKTRKVTNRLWPPMISLGIVLLILDAVNSGIQSLIPAAVAIGVVFVFVYIIYYFGVFGGADAKALILIGLMVPLYPSITLFGYDLPFAGVPIHRLFALSVLGNGVFLSIIIPVVIFIYNLTELFKGKKMPERLFLLLVGYRREVKKLKDYKHLRLLESYEETGDGRVHKRYKLGGVKIDDEVIEELEKWLGSGKIGTEVWVTPGLPFMIPITLGFLSAVVWGDLIDSLVKLALGLI